MKFADMLRSTIEEHGERFIRDLRARRAHPDFARFGPDDVDYARGPFVTCPVCGRRNLGALDVRDYHSEVFGYFRGGDVPPHTPAPPSLAEAVRAAEASKRNMRSEDERHADAVRRWYDSREWER